MLFSTSIPDKLQEHPNVSAFMSVLDSLQNFKTEIIAESLRVDNFAVLMDRKWLLKKLEEFGITNIPLDYPIQIIRQYLLNVDTVCRTRGSKIGIEFYCSLLSFGEVTVEDSSFYGESEILFLDSVDRGFLVNDNDEDFFYLCSDSSEVNPDLQLIINIRSKYFNGQYPQEEAIIKNYLESTINDQIGFSPNKKVTFNYSPCSDFYYHKLLNSYFV